MERLILCEILDCGKPASAICLKDKEKKRRCKKHAFDLLTKGYTAIGVDGDDFVSDFSDIQEYRGRKALAERGIGNLTALEVACDSEYQAACALITAAKEKVLSAVQARFDEMKLAIWQRSEEVKQQLSALHSDFTAYLASKDCALTPGAALLCSDLAVQPRFIRFEVADVQDEVSRRLMDGWVISREEVKELLKCLDAAERSSVAASLLAEAAEQAQKGILEALQFADFLVSDLSLYEKDRGEVQTKLLQYEKSRLKPYFQWLQRAWDLRQRYQIVDEYTISVGVKLASLYGPNLDADKILRRCYDIARKQDPLSEVSISLCCEICGVYFASGQYLQVEQLGMWILDAFGAVDLPAEYYWTTLLYLTCSMREVSRKNEATAILENWGKRVFCEQNKLSEMLYLLTFGIEGYYKANKEQATQCLSSSRRIGMSHFPTSPFTALSLYYFALIAENEDAKEQLYLQAHSIYEVVAPKTLQAANTLYELGCYFTHTLHMNIITAICYFEQALIIYEVAAPNSVKAAYNLNKLGTLHNLKGQQRDALRYYQQAQYILNADGTEPSFTVFNLRDLVKIYTDLGNISEATECYKQVRSSLKVSEVTCTLAIEILQGLGDLLSKDTTRWEEAIECFQQVQDIMERFDPMSDRLPYNYLEMGKVFEGRNQTSQAIEYYEKAAAIFGERNNLDWKEFVEKKAQILMVYTGH